MRRKDGAISNKDRRAIRAAGLVPSDEVQRTDSDLQDLLVNITPGAPRLAWNNGRLTLSTVHHAMTLMSGDTVTINAGAITINTN